MEVLENFVLADGRNGRILRQITPAAGEVPETLIRYFISSLGYDYYRQFVNDQNYWRLYYRTAFDNEGAADYFYIAEVEGEFAARMWFGVDPVSGFGNFGNVYTEPAFRKLGLMNRLLTPCVRDFLALPAVMLCCSTGSEYAAAAYRAGGFHMIYPGNTGPMCLLNPKHGSHFSEVEKRVFDRSPISKVRCGTAGDQFPCDKLLAYCSALYGVPQGRAGADAFVGDYRIAYQEFKNNNGTVCVAENGTGTPVGWAYAVKAYKCNCLNFAIHPDNSGQLRELLDFTIAEFKKLFSGEPVAIYLRSSFQYQIRCLKEAGFTPAAEIPGIIPDEEKLIIYQL